MSFSRRPVGPRGGAGGRPTMLRRLRKSFSSPSPPPPGGSAPGAGGGGPRQHAAAGQTTAPADEEEDDGAGEDVDAEEEGADAVLRPVPGPKLSAAWKSSSRLSERAGELIVRYGMGKFRPAAAGDGDGDGERAFGASGRAHYCDALDLRMTCSTWNVNGRAPDASTDMRGILGADLEYERGGRPDIVALTLEECVPLTAGNVLADAVGGSGTQKQERQVGQWHQKIEETINVEWGARRGEDGGTVRREHTAAAVGAGAPGTFVSCPRL